jgi:8-oxo-dGTP diphosphatase
MYSKLIIVIGICLLLSVCKKDAPLCQTAPVINDLKGNAGCWLTKDNRLLMIMQTNSLYSFPGGTSEFAESAQCTAHRETWEEAGVNVVVGNLKHQFDNGFFLFECTYDHLNLATNDSSEVSSVALVDPASIPEDKWRFPAQRQLSIEWLNGSVTDLQ